MEYKYGCLHRPAMLGTVPKDGLLSIVDADKGIDGYWNIVTYSRKLTDQEVSGYELAPINDRETVNIPAVNSDADVYFIGTEEEQKQHKRECVANMRAWKNIVENPRFSALQFGGNPDNTYFLHPSVREGVVWQLSILAPDGFFSCHTDYTFDTLRSKKKLYEDLLQLSKSGATVTVAYL